MVRPVIPFSFEIKEKLLLYFWNKLQYHRKGRGKDSCLLGGKKIDILYMDARNELLVSSLWNPTRYQKKSRERRLNCRWKKSEKWKVLLVPSRLSCNTYLQTISSSAIYSLLTWQVTNYSNISTFWKTILMFLNYIFLSLYILFSFFITIFIVNFLIEHSQG